MKKKNEWKKKLLKILAVGFLIFLFQLFSYYLINPDCTMLEWLRMCKIAGSTSIIAMIFEIGRAFKLNLNFQGKKYMTFFLSL